jgi:hypothetical protein
MRFDKKTKRRMQEEFCEKNKLPFVANFEFCIFCGKHFWKEIGKVESMGEHITSCKRCRRSFLE